MKTRFLPALLAALLLAQPALVYADNVGAIQGQITQAHGAPVSVSGAPTNGQVLIYSSTTGTWGAGTSSGPTTDPWSTVLSNGATTGGQKPAISAGDYVIFNDSSGAAVSAASTGRLIYNSSTQTFQVSQNGVAYVSLVTASSLSLQGAYDGGPNVTTVGTSTWTNSAANNNPILALVRSPAASQSGRVLTVTGGANLTSAAMYVSNAGSGAAVESDNSGAASAFHAITSGVSVAAHGFYAEMGPGSAGTGVRVEHSGTGPVFGATSVWNAGGTTFRGVEYAVTNTASAAASTALRILGGAGGATEIFSVLATGGATVTPATTGVSALTLTGGTVTTNSPLITTSQVQAATSGTVNVFNLAATLNDAATNSTTVARHLYLNPTYNYTGGTRSGTTATLQLDQIQTSMPTGSNHSILIRGGAAGTTTNWAVDSNGYQYGPTGWAARFYSQESASACQQIFLPVGTTVSQTIAVQPAGSPTTTVGVTTFSTGWELYQNATADSSIWRQYHTAVGYHNISTITGTGTHKPFVWGRVDGARDDWAALPSSGAGVQVTSDGIFGGTSSATDATGAADWGMSRGGAPATIYFGNGTAANAGATIVATTLNLVGTSNQIVLQSSGVTGTITWTPATSNKTLTIPNLTGTAWTSGGQNTFATGLGAITQILGPTDQNFLIAAGLAASGTGRALTSTAGAGGSSGSTGGANNVTGGAGNSSGNSLGGAVNITSGAGFGSQESGAINVSTGAPGSTGRAGPIYIFVGTTNNAFNGNGVTITGGVGGTSGGAGGDVVCTGGASTGSTSNSGGMFRGVGGAGSSSNGYGGRASLEAGAAGGTDQLAGGVLIDTGAGRGTGYGSILMKASPSGTTGSSSRTTRDRLLVSGKRKALTDATDTTFALCSVASSEMTGCTVIFTIRATDGTDFQSLSGAFTANAVNKAGTVTVAYSAIALNPAAACSAGTLTATTKAVASGTDMALQVNADTSLTTTTFEIEYTIVANGRTAITEQ